MDMARSEYSSTNILRYKMTIQRVTVDITTVAGAGSGNTDFMRGLARLIYCKPPNETDDYTITLTDDNSRIVYKREVVGTLRDTTPLLVLGIYTVNITGQSSDGANAVYLMMEERK